MYLDPERVLARKSDRQVFVTSEGLVSSQLCASQRFLGAFYGSGVQNLFLTAVYLNYFWPHFFHIGSFHKGRELVSQEVTNFFTTFV